MGMYAYTTCASGLLKTFRSIFDFRLYTKPCALQLLVLLLHVHRLKGVKCNWIRDTGGYRRAHNRSLHSALL